ncbi:hypothetical protein [Novosphingobium gossypii]|uniref:hypothetical protein n=1 Tax=Novosphingobium gossypii TaxID=1604774 RepID=UPI003D234A70
MALAEAGYAVCRCHETWQAENNKSSSIVLSIARRSAGGALKPAEQAKFWRNSRHKKAIMLDFFIVRLESVGIR